MAPVRWDSCHSRRLTSTRRFVRWAWPQPPSLLVVQKAKERGVTIMSMLFNRTAIVPVWFVVFGLFAWFALPMTFGTGVLLLMVGIVSPAIVLTLWREPAPTVAEVLHHVHGSRTES